MTIRHTTRCEDCKSDPDALTEIGEGVIIRGGRENLGSSNVFGLIQYD